MATYRLVQVPNSSIRRRWTIERTVPGARPERLPFQGKRGEAEAEMNRLRRLDGAAPPSGDSAP